MSPRAGFEPAIPTHELPQTHTLDPAATGTGATKFNVQKFYFFFFPHSVLMFFLYGSKLQEVPTLRSALYRRTLSTEC